MSTSSSPLTDRAAFERFKETNPQLGSALKIAAIPEADFVSTYADQLEGRERQAYRIHQTAVRVQQQAALVWANLKDVASPFLQQTLFNNIPSSFLEQQQQIPGYDRLFGSLNYIECDESRSVLSPAAYFVDLMRFVEEAITDNNSIPSECQLEQRRPDLLRLRLDDENTFNLVPYIDLVNEVLETLVTDAENPHAETVVEAAVFPQALPLNLPLAEIRAYLQQLDWNLSQIYETFTKDDQQTNQRREQLSLSPQEFALLDSPLGNDHLATVYGFETLAATLSELASVEVFLERTQLTRQELNDLVYQDLNRFEVNAGLSRLFFVNAVEDGLGQLIIQQGPGDSENPTRPPEETLLNLSAAKLDRIYRFLKLARRLDWSFADLDWALRSLETAYTPERVLQLDGLNDFVHISAVEESDSGLASLQETFTVEAWVNPLRHQANPIISQGMEDNTEIHFLLCLTPDGRVTFYGSAAVDESITSWQMLTVGEFTHVAVTVQTTGNQSTVQIYINGELDREGSLPAVQFPEGNLAVNIGRNLSDITFAGLIKDVRVWSEVRTAAAIFDSRYRRLTGFETNLAAYWPLTETHGVELLERTPYRQHGVAGGERFVTQPTWVSADLVLEPLPEHIGSTGYQFNGVDQFLAARGVTGLEADQFTLEAWIRVDVAGRNFLLSKGNGGNNQVQFLLWVDEQNRLVFRSTSLGVEEFRSQTEVTLATLTHVAVTIGAEEICLYLNGHLDQMFPRPDNTERIAPYGDDLTIGGDFSENYFSGVIYELRLWNYARSVVELNSFLQRSVPSLAPGLIGYWPLMEISGDLAVDLSVNQNSVYLGGVPEDFQPAAVEVMPLLPTLPIAVPGATLQFDGDQDLLVLRHDSNFGLGRYPRFTLEFWFKPIEQAVNPETPQLLFSQGDGEAGLAIYLERERLVAIAWCANYELTDVQETVLASGENAVAPDQWHHIAIVHDETQNLDYIEFRSFLNGIALDEISNTHSNTSLQAGQRGYRLSPVGMVYLGGIDTTGITRFQGTYLQADDARLRGFSGQMTDLRLWQQARKAEVIAAERHQAPDLDDENLIAYLPLDEGQDITVTDREHGYTGQLRGQDAVLMAAATTDPELQNRYTHYAPAGEAVLDWRNYAYTGMLYVPTGPAEETIGGLGVTFLNRHPDQVDQFYRLQVTWPEGQPTFSLAAHPQGVQPLTVDQADFPAPEPGSWYHFWIEATGDESRTNITVTLWPEGENQPTNPQVTASDNSDVRITSGAVGLWVAGDQPETLMARFNNLRVVTLGGGEELLIANFKNYLPGENPTGWMDTGDLITPLYPSGLFSPLELQGRTVLGTDFATDSTLAGIHSHYFPAGSDVLDWANYSYRGKLRFSDDTSGIGLTVLSRTPENIDQYYVLRRDADQPTLHLAAHPLGVQPLTAETSLDSGLLLQPDTDYFVLIEVNTTETRTEIRAKVWETGTLEPSRFQIRAFDDSDIRISTGTVGVWAAGPGTKTFDDLTVHQETLFAEDFSTYGPDEDPVNWLDTGANNSRGEAPDLFRTTTIDGEVVFGTQSAETNIHSHYQSTEALDWTNYTYTGRMLAVPNENGDIGGLGVTFFSRYPDADIDNHDQYYRLRRFPSMPTFHIFPHPNRQRLVEDSGDDTGVNPRANTWYRFLVEVNDAGTRTQIRAKVWEEDTPEPAVFQAETFDDNDSNNPNRRRLTAGTIGIWAGARGEKYFDDLQVRRGVYLSADLSLEDWQTTGSRNPFAVDDSLFVVERIPDRPLWRQVEDIPLLRQPFNLRALEFDGDRNYLALASLEGELANSVTIEAWIQPAAIDRINPIFSWGNTWFGLNDAGQITLMANDRSLSGETVLATNTFTHIAVTVAGDVVTLYVNGVAEAEGTLVPAPFTTTIDVGRFGGQYFGGQIRDLRLWHGLLTEFPIHQRYQTPDIPSTTLLAFWSFADVADTYTLDRSANNNHLRLGGLEPARKPTLFEQDLPADSAFFQPGRSFLTFNSAADGIAIPAGTTVPKRHTIEVWVNVSDPHLSQRRQVIYHSGDAEQGLVIYVHDGRLYFGGYNQTNGWSGTWLQTDRILAHRWHHIALVLDGRAELRPQVFQAYLDGKLVDLGDGVELTNLPTNVLGAAAGDIHFNDSVIPATDTANTYLDGAVLELRLWDTARTATEIADYRYAVLTGDEPNLSLWWRFEDISMENPVIADGSDRDRTATLTNLDRLQPLASLTIGNLPSPILSQNTLLNLATFRQLMDRHRQSVEQLTALWYDLRHTGWADHQVFFDRVFNSTGLTTNAWTYHDPARRWDVTGQELPSRDRAIRSRLMGALQLSSDDLDRIVALVSGTETLVEVDTSYLRQLYRLSQIPRVLRLTVDEYLVVLKMLDLNGIESLTDLASVSDRVVELRRIGIRADELNFFANDVPTDRIRPPYTDATIRIFADEVVNQSIEYLIAPLTFTSDDISELQSTTIVDFLKLSEEEVAEDTRMIGVLTSRYFLDALGAVTDRYQEPADLRELAIAHNWAIPFADLGEEIVAALQSAGFVNEYGIILRSEDLDQFPKAFGDNLPNPTILAEIQAVLENQNNRQTTITETLVNFRDEHRSTILAGLSALLGTEPEPLQAVIAYFQSVGEPLGDPARLLESLMELDEEQPIPAKLLDYFFRLYKILLLVTRFELTIPEIQALLEHPACFSVSDVFRPTLTDLVNLFTFTELKTAFGGDDDQLLQLLRLNLGSPLVTESILQISDWDLPQLHTLTAHFGTNLSYNRVENLILLQRGFALADTLRVDISFMLQLASTEDLSLTFYRQQADNLLSALRGLYDDEQWPQVFRPLRDPLAIQKRDALLVLAMADIPRDFAGRRSPDLLSEYLLLDVQVSSAVETSRIVQGTAALQQYVQRCLMNLEKGVNPATIPQDQWNWMQNFRVWEANRKVFLFPESYIEPELRDTKTPLFEDLEQELMQNDINVDTATQAFNNYLNKLAELADLKIVGSYLHRDVALLFTIGGDLTNLLDQLNGETLTSQWHRRFDSAGYPLAAGPATVQGESPFWRIVDSGGQTYTVRLTRDREQLMVSQAGDSTLYLVGRSTAEPRTYYYREWINETQWRPWQQIDLTINADFVTPVFIFNRLFLFWVEFTPSPQRSGGASADDVFRATIRYSFPDFNGIWTTPQVYTEVARDLTMTERLRPEWQRVYALRTTFEVSRLSDIDNIQERERLLIIHGDQSLSGANRPINVRTLRNARDQEPLRLQFQQLSTGVDLNLSSRALGTLLWQLGHMTSSNAESLNNVAGGNATTEDRNALKNILNDLFNRPVATNPTVPTDYEISLAGDNQWFITFEDNFDHHRWLARLEDIPNDGNGIVTNINVYNLSDHFLQSLVHLASTETPSVPRYMGFFGNENDTLLENPDASQRQSLRELLVGLFDRPAGGQDLASLLPSGDYELTALSGDNRWAIHINATRLLIRSETIRPNEQRFNVYLESAEQDISPLMGRYVGYMTVTPHQNNLNSLANGDTSVRANLHSVLTALFDRNRTAQQGPAIPLVLPSSFDVRFLESNNGWLLTFANHQLVARVETNLSDHPDDPSDGTRINVYALDTPFLNVDFGLEDQGSNRWLFSNSNQGGQVLIAPQQPLQLRDNEINIFQFATSARLQSSPSNNEPEVNEYLSALAQVGPSTQGDQSALDVLNGIPLSATLLDVNNQHGWYVLDTGEEQFLVRSETTALATDAERLIFQDSGSANLFTFAVDPQLAMDYRFDRIDTIAARELGVILFRDGIDGLLSLAAQKTSEGNFANYRVTSPSSAGVQPPSTDTIDFDGAYGLYYREIFFHIPFFIANQLNTNQNFADAQRWYHYIFNPTSSENFGNTSSATTGNTDNNNNNNRYWQYLPLRDLDLESLATILNNEEALADYREDPFAPHAIARLRINAYQKAIVMKYIDNLLDWGDNLFAQENRESINQAFLLYILAFNLLGPRPEARASRRFEEIGNYQGIREAFGETPEFLTELDLNGNVAARTSSITLNQNGNIITTFCIPENSDFIGFWDRVENRLFNIRHSLNIEGIFRQLPLFQPPLDVRALVRAFANGNRDIGSLLSDLNRPVPHYRYSFMLERAKEMIGNVKDFGAALLDALEKRDAEQLAVLQTTHERNILELMTRVRELEIAEARDNLEALRTSRANLQNRFDHFDTLIEGGIGLASLNAEEVTDLTLTGIAQIVKTATVLPGQIAGAIAKASPDITSGSGINTLGVVSYFEVETGGDKVGAIFDGVAAVGQTIAELLQTSADLTANIGEYKRRRNGWVLERRTAELDVQEADQQIAITELQIQRVEQELRIHERSIENNQEVADFYRRKFTNEALYSWMSSRLSGLYFQAYKLAYDFAKGAERALQYELPTNEQFINFGHWDSRRRGLLAGEALMLDVSRMEKFHLDNDSRFQEIDKTVSLSQVDPAAQEQLLANGECDFSLTEALYNRDYPGHYFRVIKSMALSLEFVEDSPPSYFTVNASLTQVGNKTLLDPDINAVRYLMGIEGATQPSGTALRVNWRSNQQIAVSSPRRDNGMFGSFDLNFVFDDRYFPFEGTGAVSNWHLEMPLENNPALVQRIEGKANRLALKDVMIHIQYTSKFDRGEFKTQVQEEMRTLDQP